MIDPQIALSVNPVKPPENPLQNVAQIAQIQDVLGQVQLRNAQMRHADQQAALVQQQAAKAARDQRDQDAVKQHFKDPANFKAFMASGGDLSNSPLAQLVQPETLFDLSKKASVAAKDYQTARSDKVKNDIVAMGNLHNSLQSMIEYGEKNPGSTLSDVYASARENSPYLKDLPFQLPADIKTVDEAKKYMAVVAGYHGMALNELERQKTQGEIANKTASTANLTAQNPGLVAESQIKTNQEAGMDDRGLMPNEQVQEKEAIARTEQAKANAAEALRHNRATEAEGWSKVALERSKDAREQQIYNQTYGEGANPALVGVDPKLRTQAASAAQKAATEHVAATASADEMKSVIDLMRSGNKLAYAYSPVTGVLTINSANGVKRINMPEIHSYGVAGSTLDNIEGWLGKHTTGASISKSVVDDMEKFHSALDQVAERAYNDKISAINQNYRSNFQPVKRAGTQASGGGGGQVKLKAPNGQTMSFPAGSPEIQHYKQLGATEVK